jgi:hypothetical protein
MTAAQPQKFHRIAIRFRGAGLLLNSTSWRWPGHVIGKAIEAKSGEGYLVCDGEIP